MMQADSVEAVRLAVLNFTVHAIGIAIIGAVYLNFVLIKTYFRPLFWACLLSVPLHSIKRRLLKGFQAGLENGGLFNAFIAGFIRRPFEILLGPFADVVFAVLESYLNAVKFISHVGNMEPMNTLQSAATDSSKTISNSQNRHCKVSSKTRSETRVDDDNDAEYQDESDPDSLPSSASDNEINRSSTASFSTPVPTKRRHGYNMRDSPRFITKIHRSGTPTSRTRGTPSAAARIGLNGSGITPISSPIYHHHHQNHHLLSHHKKIRFVHRKILNEPILEPFRRLTRRWAKGLKKLSQQASLVQFGPTSPISGVESPNTFLFKIVNTYYNNDKSDGNNTASSPLSRPSLSSSESSSQSSLHSLFLDQHPAPPLHHHHHHEALLDSNSSTPSIYTNSLSSTPVANAEASSSSYSFKKSRRFKGENLGHLVLWSTRYILFLWFKDIFQKINPIAILSPLPIFILVHIAFHFGLRIYRLYLEESVGKLLARVISSGVWRSTIIPLSRLALFSRSSVSSSTKAFLLKNLNGITSMVLILVALFLSNATTLILIFKVAHEGSLLLDTAILPALNRSVVFHQTDQVRASLEEALDKWSVLESFVDRDTLEKYPGLSNLTVKQLYNGLVTSLDIGSSFAKRGGQGSGGSYGVCHHVGVSKTHLYFPFNICLHLPSHLDECKTFPNLYSTSFTLITNPLLSTSTAAAAETNLQSTATSLKEYPITSSLLQNFKSWKFQSVIELAGPSFNEIKSVLLSNNITTSFGVVVVNGGGGGPGNKDNKTSSFTNPDHLDVLRALSSATALGASYLFNWSVNVFIFSVNTLMNAFDLVFKATLFFAALYAFLVDDKGIVFKASRVLLVLDPKERLRIQLEHGIKSALVVNLKLTLYHAIFTWLTFHAAGCELVYIPTFLAGLLSLIPLISPMYIFLPGSVSLFFRFSAPWGVIFAAAFCIAHLFVAFVVDSRIVESEMVLRVNKRKLAGIASSGDLFEPSTPVLAPSNSKADDTSAAEDSDTILMSYSRPNAIIIGLCFWLGYWNFGGIEGLVLAPILVSCVPILISHFYGKLVASSK